jgi:adenine-specific DNA-methyltransferase
MKWKRGVWDAFAETAETLEPVGSREWRAGNRVRHGDAADVLSSLPASAYDLIYMDPPYTKDHYSRFYHVYEELFLYRYPTVSGHGLYPDRRFASPFSIKSKAIGAYERLFQQAARVAPAMVLSFPEATFLGQTEAVLFPVLEKSHNINEIICLQHLHSSLGGSPGFASTPVVELVIDCEARR